MRVLITGAAGYVGRHLASGLQADHDLQLADVSPPVGDGRWMRLDVTRPEEVEQAVRGVEAVIHLAVASGHEGEHEDDSFNQVRFDVNVKGTWNVLEAARRAGVRRFDFTSSLMVVWGYEPPQWVSGDAPPRPVGTYAVTKQLGESLAEYQARTFGLSVMCLRIAKPIDPTDPVKKRIRPRWLAFPDLIEAYRLALAAPGIEYEIVTLVGESSRRRWDLSRAERALGYRPAVRLEERGDSWATSASRFERGLRRKWLTARTSPTRISLNAISRPLPSSIWWAVSPTGRAFAHGWRFHRSSSSNRPPPHAEPRGSSISSPRRLRRDVESRHAVPS